MCIDGATDSKRLRPRLRETLAGVVRERAIGVGVGAASVAEIDRVDILGATTLAVRRALDALPVEPDHVVVDGLPLPRLGRAHDAVVGGDGRVHCVACASIVAKVLRDRLMRRLALRYPLYGWEGNMGYGTPVHLEAIRRHGPSPHHRLTFVDLQLDLGL